MNDKTKKRLVELLQQMSKKLQSQGGVTWYDFADHLIAHGVTVQEWISVNDRLPKIYDKDSDWSGTVLFRTTQGHIHSGRRKFGRHRMSFWIDESDNLFFSKEEVTHWMPLPQPPKGE